jgi:hypothetical protein
MKIESRTKPLAVAFLAATLSPMATLRAQEVTYELAPSAVTLAFVIKKTTEGTFERDDLGGAFIKEDRKKIPAFENTWKTGRVVDGSIPEPTRDNFEFVSKISSTRYGNRELIQDLVDQGEIPGPVSGWKLVYVYEDPTESEEATLVARKRGQDDVELDILDIEISGGAYAANFLETTAFKYDKDGGITSEVATVRGRSNWEDAVSLEFNIGEFTATLGGLEIGSETLFSYYPNPEDRSSVEFFGVPGASRMTNLVGTAGSETSQEGDEEFFEADSSLVTGTASIGASRVITKKSK